MSNNHVQSVPGFQIGRRTMLRLGLGAAFLPAAGPAALAEASDDQAAKLPIRRLDDALLAAMKMGRATPFAQRYAAVAPAVEQALDLRVLLAASVGLSWATLPSTQQSQLLDAFRRYTEATYTANFDSYAGQSFRIAPAPRSLPDGRIVLQTAIVRADGSQTALNYVMRQTGPGWKAVDVLADGSISRVAVQRSDFGHLLAAGGAPALMAGLERKVASLSGGTAA